MSSSNFSQLSSVSDVYEQVRMVSAAFDSTSYESAIEALDAITDPTQRQVVILYAMAACRGVAKNLAAMQTSMGRLPSSFMIEEKANMTLLAMIGHLIFSMSRADSAEFFSVKSSYQVSIGRCPSIFAYSAGKCLKQKRNEVLLQNSQKVQPSSVSYALLDQMFASAYPRFFHASTLNEMYVYMPESRRNDMKLSRERDRREKLKAEAAREREGPAVDEVREEVWEADEGMEKPDVAEDTDKKLPEVVKSEADIDLDLTFTTDEEFPEGPISDRQLSTGRDFALLRNRALMEEKPLSDADILKIRFDFKTWDKIVEMFYVKICSHVHDNYDKGLPSGVIAISRERERLNYVIHVCNLEMFLYTYLNEEDGPRKMARKIFPVLKALALGGLSVEDACQGVSVKFIKYDSFSNVLNIEGTLIVLMSFDESEALDAIGEAKSGKSGLEGKGPIDSGA